jgi:hypothetical protein
MSETLEDKAEQIVKQGITNIELISYFKRSTIKTPVFLSVINRNYAEIKPLLSHDLIRDFEPVKSYEFNIDKLENYFYELYQEKIDFLKDKIWRRRRKKEDFINQTEELTPQEGVEDYEEKLRACIEFARQSVVELDKMELEKEDFNNDIGILQEKMAQDPMYKFLFYIRNEKKLIFNKRTEDNFGHIHKIILKYANASKPEMGGYFLTELKEKGFYKEYSPAKNYYITKLGLLVDEKLKSHKWDQEDDYEKTEEEKQQEEEFSRLLESINI